MPIILSAYTWTFLILVLQTIIHPCLPLLTDFPEYVVNPDHWFVGCEPSSKACAANLTKEEL